MSLGRGVRLAAVGALVAGLVGAAAPSSQAVDVPIFPGSLPDSGSAVTVAGRGPASDFAVHVNQTTNLTTQAVSLSWSWPGHDSIRGYAVDGNGLNIISGSGAAALYLGNYVQIMQCWGDAVTQADVDAATGEAKLQAEANYVPGNEGPSREQCEYGGTAQRTSNLGELTNLTSAIQDSRSAGGVAAATGQSYYGDETAYQPDQVTYRGFPEVPFRSVDGVVTRNSLPLPAPGTPPAVWSNNYFGRNTTNEINVGPVTNGTGGVTFQAQNSLDAPGLGCGAATASGALNKCWLVVVPRVPLTTVGGTTEVSSRKQLLAGTTSARTTLSSPLASTLWANRIAIPLDFRPTLDACASANSNYLTVGSDLPQNALLSWQAGLCSGGNGSTGYTYTYTPDSVARQDLTSGSSSMRLVSDPVPTSQVFDPTTYAPLTVSGISVSFVFEPAISTSTNPFSAPEVHVKLDQRLVAKALTQSYIGANPWRVNAIGEGTPPASDYGWLVNNPYSLWQDPEFWELNPDIVAAYPEIKVSGYDNGLGATGYLQVNGVGSDGYAAVWKWLLADKDTRLFLAGVANPSDPSGMKVDPYYSTNPDINPSGAAFDPSTLDYFPSLDPWLGDPFGYVSRCTTPQPNNPVVGSIDLAPFASSLQAVARNITRVDPLNKAVNYNCVGSTGRAETYPDSPIGWLPQYSPALPGQRKMLGLTDTASSAQYGVTTAYLRNSANEYVAPTVASMQAAAAHLTYEGGVQGVGQPDRTTSDPAAYPLTMITYAATQTDKMDRPTCAAYASLLDYAAGKGQTSGAGVGQLPYGYAPLTPTLKAQTAAAARTVAACAQKPGEQPPADDTPPPAASAPLGTTPADNPVAPAVSAPGAAVSTPALPTTPPVSLASNRGTTKPDPSVFAWVIPIALLVGLLSLLLAPIAGLRRRPGRPKPGGVG